MVRLLTVNTMKLGFTSQSVTSLNVNIQVSQVRLSEKTPLFLVCVYIFVDSTINKWDYSAVNIFVAVLS